MDGFGSQCMEQDPVDKALKPWGRILKQKITSN